jgi:hypothetical protein
MLNQMQFLKNKSAVTIMTVAFIIPNVFVHIWWVRLLCIFIISLAAIYEIVRQLIHSDLIFRDASLWNPKAKKMFILFARTLGIAMLPLFIYFGIFTPIKDGITMLVNGEPITSIVKITNNDTGLTWLGLRKLEISGEHKGLPMYLLPLRTGEEYVITHVAGSYLIYDAIPVETDLLE